MRCADLATATTSKHRENGQANNDMSIRRSFHAIYLENCSAGIINGPFGKPMGLVSLTSADHVDHAISGRRNKSDGLPWSCNRNTHIQQKSHPSAILALVYVESRLFRVLETMEQDLLSYHEDLMWKSDFAEVAPECLPRLNSTCLKLLIDISAFCKEASNGLQANLPPADARKLTSALYQFFRTTFRHVKLTEESETQKINKSGQE